MNDLSDIPAIPHVLFMCEDGGKDFLEDEKSSGGGHRADSVADGYPGDNERPRS